MTKPAEAPALPTLDVVTSLAAMDAIAADWRALESAAVAPVLFQSFAWSRVVAERLLVGRDRNRPWIVTLRERGRLIAVAPLSLNRLGPVRVAAALGEPLAQYSDMLVSPDAPWAGAALIAELHKSGRIDHLRLRRVRGDAAIAHALGDARTQVLHPNLARHGEITRATDVHAFTSRIDRKAARDRQRLERKLKAAGQVEIVQLGPGRRASEAAELAVAWKRNWLARRHITGAIFVRRRWLAIIATLVAEPSIDSHTTIVLLDGEPAAIEIGFRHNRRHYAFLGAARPGLERLSPNKAAMTAALAHCIDSGVEIYDLLGPDEPYKRHWCPDTTPTHDRTISFTGLGSMYGRLDEAGQRGVARLLKRGPAAPSRTG